MSIHCFGLFKSCLTLFDTTLVKALQNKSESGLMVEENADNAEKTELTDKN